MRKQFLNGFTSLALGLSGFLGNSAFSQTPSPQHVQPQLEERLTEKINPASEEKRAVIINASDDDHLWSVEKSYDLFTKHLGYDSKNVIVLSYEIPQDLSNESIVATASKENVIAVMNYFVTVTDNNDVVYIKGTGHGAGSEKTFDKKSWLTLDSTIEQNESFCCIQHLYSGSIEGNQAAKEFIKKEHLNEEELASLIEPMKGQIIVDVDMCYSGGFCSPFIGSRAKVIALSNTDRHHATDCRKYVEGFYDGIVFNYADVDHDGHVTLREAKNYAILQHRRDEQTRHKTYVMNNWSTNGHTVASPTSAKPEEIILK